MEKINSLFSAANYINEHMDQALFSIENLNLETLKLLNNFAGRHSDFFTVEVTTEFGEHSVLPSTSPELLNQKIEILIKKTSLTNTAYFFSLQGFENGIALQKVETKKAIYINYEFEEFSSRTCTFKKWIQYPNTSFQETDNIDARKFIKDASAGELSKNIEFWIIKKEPIIKNDVYAAWIKNSIPKSSLLFCSEIWKEETSLRLIVNGSQKLETTLENTHLSTIKTTAPECIYSSANWLLEIDREVEIRHQLLCTRISSQKIKSHEDWISFLHRTLPKNLENAKNDYKAHLHSKTSETLKAIADIRKIIAEESSKVIERTHALSATLFRDIAIAFSAISIRIISISNNSNLDHEKTVLLILSACWLATSLKMTTRANFLYIKSLTKSRFSWSRKVNTTIPISEFKELSEKPFKDAVQAYNQIRKLAEKTYLTAILLLIFFAFYKPIFEFLRLVFSARC
ncbi:hypothetical protein SAMN05660489_00172 [Pseudomonas sp. LAMO17WK12:I10]|uniref:hypothetical protein n=1 Tax=unclassified Pseudomonas TaxID=196821 RepID=UPI000BCC51DB|nr:MULTISPECIES: hypothetical protein [unclassified Pseudomonas]PXX76578.1 hypothetical protein H160_00349 [Pseudomonas sp. LAMO17WK12:I9]SNY04338.1 hypothetical protein SAMN05660489_00172 [Pseudomonas sp. LAMO17WK12:I10]